MARGIKFFFKVRLLGLISYEFYNILTLIFLMYLKLYYFQNTLSDIFHSLGGRVIFKFQMSFNFCVIILYFPLNQVNDMYTYLTTNTG